MTMLKTFDLKGNKKSFAEWISNLSPCETPFTSMVGKESVDQTQYSWQVDYLAKPANEPHVQEGSVVTFAKPTSTKVLTNFTQIFRKAVRVADTTKKISLYGRGSELGYQMEKAGMEIKRDMEFHFLNTVEEGRPGTAAVHGIATGIQRLVAPRNQADPDTGGVVHKTIVSEANKPAFSKEDVFDMTYNLYLVGSRASKIMFHPAHMAVFSDWIGNHIDTEHVVRMFDGLDPKYNSFVSSFRDPLGQKYELIPNRYMPKNQLFFFNEADWTQMILREPTRVELAKNGSSEKHLIEMEIGLRHRNPFASGILEFTQTAKNVVKGVKSVPTNIKADGSTTSTVSVIVEKPNGAEATAAETVSFTAVTINDDGTTSAATVDGENKAPAKDETDGSPTKGSWVAKGTVKHNKSARVKVKATVKDGDETGGTAEAVVDTYESRD